MEYNCTLKKPLPTRRSIDGIHEPTTEQVALVNCITAAILGLLRDYLAIVDRDDLYVPGNPFELFELCDDLCDARHLDRQCAIMLELTGCQPKVVWNDDDLMCLQQKQIERLRRIETAIANYKTTDDSFASLKRTMHC